MAASRAGRVASALRAFQLPPDATAADLRQAYLREAKRLHPDARAECDKGRATKEFAELRARFDEALGLLSGGGMAGPSGHSEQEQRQRPPWADGRAHYGWSQRGGSASSSARAEYKRWTWETASGPYPGRPATPVVGFPAQFVYTAAGSLALVAAGLLILRTGRQEDDARLSPDVMRLRQAMEAGGAESVAARLPSLRSHSSASEKSSGSRVSPVHLAAQDGHVWWIERCGAIPECQEALDDGDRRGDTPLHFCARRGDLKTASALLRVGADPGVANYWRLWPEDLAAQEGHQEVAQILRAARLQMRRQRERSQLQPPPQDETAGGNHQGKSSPNPFHSSRAWLTIGRHPDGLGVLCDLPDDVPYAGPHASESLRHAVNLAVGRDVLGRLKLDRADPKDNLIANASVREGGGGGSGKVASHEGCAHSAAELALERVRGALRGTNVELEEAAADPSSLKVGVGGWFPPPEPAPLEGGRGGREISGLLLFEPAGVVSRDSPGHWHAVRPSRLQPPEYAADLEGADARTATPGHEVTAFYRLDSVRGGFRLSHSELDELLSRYRMWRVISQHAEPESVGSPCERPSAAHATG